jgi:serine/threonine-protein kinase HipA
MKPRRGIVYKGDVVAATLGREPDGVTAFTYLSEYLASGRPAVATTLPLTDRPRITQAGAVPPFFAGLLPEGRRLTALRTSIKASADDELSLILAVGTDLIGDVRVVPEGSRPEAAPVAIEIPKDPETIRFSEILAASGIDKVGIPGVQDKVSARMISLPARRAGERYILKLSPPEYPHVVENEAFFIRQARRAGLPTVHANEVTDANGVTALLVRRFDRTTDGGGIAAEDACQALDLWPADKYNVTMEQAARALIDVCAAPAVAALAVFRQVLFSWLTGNGDLHAKNLSILQTESGEWRMSPAYDLPSTVLYGDLTFALDLQGEDSDITGSLLRGFARDIGLSDRAASAALTKIGAALYALPDELPTSSLPFAEAQLRATANELRRRRSLLDLA